jgi:hypothetical protein
VELVSSDDDDGTFEPRWPGPLLKYAARDFKGNQIRADEAEKVVPGDKADFADDEGTFEDDTSEFVEPDGVFADVEENEDEEGDEASRATMNQFLKDETKTTIQRTVPDLPRVMQGLPRTLEREDGVSEEPHTATSPPPCPLKRKQVKLCNFRVMRSDPNHVELVFPSSDSL